MVSVATAGSEVEPASRLKSIDVPRWFDFVRFAHYATMTPALTMTLLE